MTVLHQPKSLFNKKLGWGDPAGHHAHKLTDFPGFSSRPIYTNTLELPHISSDVASSSVCVCGQEVLDTVCVTAEKAPKAPQQKSTPINHTAKGKTIKGIQLFIKGNPTNLKS